MNTESQAAGSAGATARNLSIKVFGVGTAGVRVLNQLISGGLPASAAVAVGTDAALLAGSSAAEKLPLEARLLRGLGTGGDPERGRALAEEQVSRIKASCAGTDLVFVVAGLGGGTGTGISPVLARAAKETGTLVLGFVSLPFDCEGSRRQQQALAGLEELKASADGVICLPNQKVFRLIDETTSVADAFKLTNDLLADGVRGIWRLLMHAGLIEIHFPDLCALLRDGHTESVFAVAEAMGATRSREVVDKLFQHPLLQGEEALVDAAAVLVSLVGGPDLSLAEVNRVMEQVSGKCSQAQVIMGAAIDESFRERLAVTLIAAPKPTGRGCGETASRAAGSEELNQQLISRGGVARPGSRFLPPPPVLPPDQVRQMLARQGRADARSRKPARMRQTQLQLEIVSKGRFDQSEPTIHKGEDLDVPTYLRRGISLN